MYKGMRREYHGKKDSREKVGNKKAQEKIKKNRETESGGGYDDHGCGSGGYSCAGECGG